MAFEWDGIIPTTDSRAIKSYFWSLVSAVGEEEFYFGNRIMVLAGGFREKISVENKGIFVK